MSEPTSPQQPPKQPSFISQTSWKNRRIYLYILTVFFMWVIAYSLVKNLDTRTAETAVMFSIIALIGIVGSYVFGAVWDDKNQMSLLKKE